MRRFSTFFLLVGCLSILSLSGGPSEVMAASLCEGDQKIEGSGGTYEPSGQGIDSVCIKAGTDVLTFGCGDVDGTGCYSLTWTIQDGVCTKVVISGGGTSRTCKGISHTAAVFGDGPTCIPTKEICGNQIDEDCDGFDPPCSPPK